MEISNVKEYLENAKNSILKFENLKKEINTLKGKLVTFEGKKEELEKNRDNLIRKTLYEKRKEMETSYDEVLKEAEKRLEVAKKNKEEEKKKNLNSLIEKNTRNTRENNVYLNNEIKNILKENKIPFFVNSNFYLCIWAPNNIGQIFISILVTIILLLIPTVFCFFAFKTKLEATFQNTFIRYFIIVLIYIAFIFLFGLIWLFIDKITKKKPEVISKIIELRKNIKENNKEIEKIAKKTINEITDKEFDYTKLDREIDAVTIEVERRKEEKKNALLNFTEHIEKEMIETINNSAKIEIDNIILNLDNAKNELDLKQKDFDDTKLVMSNEYDIYIGKNNMTEEKLNKLIDLAEKNPDKNINDIVNMLGK